MKRHRLTKKILSLLISVLFLVLSLPFMVSAASPITIDLYAGQNTKIGTVTVSDDGTDMYVTYNITEPNWYLSQTHLYVGTSAPTKSAPGRFPYTHSGLHATSDTFKIPFDAESQYFIAAHADVLNENIVIGGTFPSLEEVNAMLPSTGVMTGTYDDVGKCFFALSFSEAGILNGSRPGWCIDRTHYIYVGVGINYSVRFYSSLGTIPSFLTTGTDPNIDRPEHLDLVNWVINHNDGFTGEEIQRVIWKILDSYYQDPPLTAHEQELYDAAFANGDGFIPAFSRGEMLGVIVVPVDPLGPLFATHQVILTVYKPPCTPTYKGETAWARGGIPFRTGWGSSFTYNDP